MSFPLEYYWKKSFDPTKPTPFGMLCSFYDLMFYWDDSNKVHKVRFNINVSPSNFLMKGYELPHNIIKFDENIYIAGSTHRDINTTKPFVETMQNSIDISLPVFDHRSKPLFLTPSNIQKYVPSLSDVQFQAILSQLNPKAVGAADYYANSGIGFKMWDKNAIMKPVDSYDFYTHSPNYTGTRDPSIADSYSDYDYTDFMYINLESDPDVSACDICINCEDVSFEDRFLDPPSGTGIYAYNGICLNYNSNRIWNIIWKQYGFQSNISCPIYVDPSTMIADIEPFWEFIIRNTYIFIKASFFADYVDYKDFDQYLNKGSDVIHKNLLVSPTGDLSRYNTAYSEGAISALDLAKNTRPYISKTTPSVDLLAPLLLPQNQYDKNNVLSTTQNLIDDASGPNSKIGALNVEPFEFFDGSLNPTDDMTDQAVIGQPPVYFDPESRKDAGSYNDIPIVVAKDGNVQINGRFIGPTIDELWQEIKMMIGGRNSDAEPKPDGGYPVGIDYGTVGNNYYVPVDTRPSIKKHMFNGVATSPNNPAVGDPVEIDYNFDNPQQALYTVTKWINDPNSINYNLLKEVDSLNDLLCQAIGMGPTKTWKKIDAEIHHLSSPNDPSVISSTRVRYDPNPTPMSLRELEGVVKGLQWNLSYLLSFLVRNNTWAGIVGYYNDDVTPTNASGGYDNGDMEGGDYYRDSYAGQYLGHAYNYNNGSVYQLHKDYDGDYARANTRYDQRVNNGTISANNPYGMPLGAKGKGLSEITDRQVPDRQGIVPAYAVFMAADGQWHAPGYQYAQFPIYDQTQEMW